ARRVRFRTADDDSLVRAVDDAEIEVRVVLLRRPLTAIALDVGDGGSRQQLLALEPLDVLDDALVVSGSLIPVEVVRRHQERLELVATDARVPGERRPLRE